MPVSLLDVNVLLALAWPIHKHHHAARRWFRDAKEQGWATCALTEAGFVRISCQPAVVGRVMLARDAFAALDAAVRVGRHEFWPLDHGCAALEPAIRRRISGAKQINDAILLHLAVRCGGRLATFDRRLQELAAGGNELALEVISG